MDRIIRLRGKRTDNNEWEYGSLYIPSDGVYADICNKSGDHPVKTETVSQLVCISDSGDEIYEGDYIRFPSKTNDIFLVRWDKSTCGFVVISSEDNSIIGTVNIHKALPIGNIWDHAVHDGKLFESED